MTEKIKNKSVIETFTRRVFIIVTVSTLSIGSLISYFSYSELSTRSKQLEKQYITSQKTRLQNEVASVERIIAYNRSKLENTLKENIKTRVYDAHTIATHLYEKYKNSKSKNEIVNLIKDALRPFRFFDGRGYIFIDNLNGKNILHPIVPNIEGTSVLKFKNQKGKYFAKDLLKTAKEKGEGFVTYDWIKPNEKGQFTKISFVKHFKPYNWSIGTGDYLVEAKRKIQKEILELIGEIKFGKEGYIFVVNYDGNVMMNRGNRSLIGKNILHVTDPNGIRVAEEVIKLAQTPGWDGYFNYNWKKLSSSKISPKVAYHKMVQDWGWYYGAGVYLDDVQEQIAKQKIAIKKELFLHLFLIALTVIIALFIIIYLAQRNTKQLQLDLNHLLDFFEQRPSKSKPLATENITFAEFKHLADSANIMLEKQQIATEKNITFEKQLQQSKKMDVVTQMVGGIAHDFNNLLAIILGYGELLESKFTGDKYLANLCHQINAAGMRGAKLTRKLLSITARTVTEPEKCDVNELLNEEQHLLKKSLTAKVSLNYDLIDNVWPVWVDPSDFEDVILNVCVNAMHAMKERQQDSKIIIATENLHFDEQPHNMINLQPGDYVQITITDNGIGMSEELQSRVFEPFYTTRETGTGLGLSQAYSFSQRSKGAVFVHSTLGEGTYFQFLLPRYKDADEPALINNSQDSLQKMNYTGTETILVVDDEKALRELCSETLSEKGYKVLQAQDGVDALVVLENKHVDLVLSDVIMPNMDGNLLAETVARLYPDIKIQLLSGYNKDEHLSEVNSELTESMLRKPVESLTLLKCIRELLDQK